MEGVKYRPNWDNIIYVMDDWVFGLLKCFFKFEGFKCIKILYLCKEEKIQNKQVFFIFNFRFRGTYQALNFRTD